MIELSRISSRQEIEIMSDPCSTFLERSHQEEKAQKELEVISLLSTSAEEEIEELTIEEEIAPVPVKNDSNDSVDANNYYHKKRQKLFSEHFSKFEEILIQEKVIDKDTAQRLKLLNGHYLDFCFTPDLKCQQLESICLSILLMSCDRIGLSKKIFVKMAKKVFKKGAVKLSRIRKSRCYTSVKKLSILVNEM